MKRMYYGWVIVAVGFLSMAFWLGINSTFSVFYATLLDEFAWQRAESAGVMAISQIVYTILAPFIGVLIHRFGPRKVVVPGILVLGVGLALCSLVQSLGQLYLFYGLPVGVGVSCISMVAFTVIISRWFDAKRGLANGIASAGMGVGMFALVPLTQHLITTLGWRHTYLVLAALVAVILLPANLIFLKHRPEDMGLLPDGITHLRKPASDVRRVARPVTDEWSIPRLSRSLTFYAMITFPALSVLSVLIIIVHNLRFLADQGVDKMTGAYAYAIVGVFAMVFRVFWGWLSDRIGRELTYSAGMIIMSAGIACLLLFAKRTDPFYIYLFAIFFGVGWGANAPIFAAAAADLFKGPLFGLIYGCVESIIGLAGALGAWVGGYIYDHTHSYEQAFILAIASALVSAALIWVAAPRKASRFCKPLSSI
jgi:MFS family permease